MSGVVAAILLIACSSTVTPTRTGLTSPGPALASPGTSATSRDAGATSPDAGAATTGPEATSAVANSAEPAASSGEGGTTAETPPYTNSRFGYSISAPGPMKEATDGSAAYVTPGEQFDITVVVGGSAADPMALAQADIAGLQGSRGYKLVAAPAKVTISGRAVVKFVFESLGATNPVTGKPYHFTNVRYYVPRDAGRLAVLAYAVFTVDYDPQNADDLETSFAWR